MTKLERRRIYQAKRRERARAAGRCIQCCVRPHANGRSRCDRCLESRRKRAPLDRAYLKVRRERAAQAGKCKTCCREDARPGSSYCEHCGNGFRRLLRASLPWCDECLCSGGHRRDCITLRVRAA